MLGAFSANSPEPTVPPLCLRTGPHFPGIRLRLAGRGPNGNSLFPPLAAVVAVAEPTVPPLCLRTGPHFPDIRWRNSQPTALGYRELYQVLLWEFYLIQ